MHTSTSLMSATLLAAAACGGAAATGGPPSAGPAPYAGAVTAVGAGDDDEALARLALALGDAEAVQRALLDPAFATLRDTERFRRLVHDASVRHAVHELRLVDADEPGEHIEVRGRTVTEHGAPVGDVVVRVFATDADGRYHPEIAGERVPRIFGTLVSDADGRFVVHTVRPGPYPGTRNPRHLHVAARGRDARLRAPGYAVFDDDPLLDEPGNEEPRDEALRVRMRGHVGTLTLPVR